MYACICHAVTCGELDAVIESGARTTDEVGAACGAGTGCGTCIGRITARLARPLVDTLVAVPA